MKTLTIFALLVLSACAHAPEGANSEQWSADRRDCIWIGFHQVHADPADALLPLLAGGAGAVGGAAGGAIGGAAMTSHESATEQQHRYFQECMTARGYPNAD